MCEEKKEMKHRKANEELDKQARVSRVGRKTLRNWLD